MAWVRIDDGFAQHPKVARAGPLAMAMQIAALCYCNRQTTDGFIPKQIASTLLDLSGLGMHLWNEGGEEASWNLIVSDLVEAGMWSPADGGWMVHDYLDYQPSRQQIQRLSSARSKAGKRGAKAKQIAQQNSSKDEAKPHPNPNPNPLKDSSLRSLSVAEKTNGHTNGYPDAFEALWRRYRTIGAPNASKATAHKSWKRLHAADRTACASGLDRYVDWLKTERQKRPDYPVKHLATFINQQGWEPFLEATATAKANEPSADLLAKVQRWSEGRA